MRISDFTYALPPELIAQAPLKERSASRLLVLDGTTGAVRDSHMRSLPDFIARGDLLVFNDTRVLPARVVGRKHSGGRVEMFLERALEAGRALVQLRSSKSLRAGGEIITPGGPVRVIDREGELWRVALPPPLPRADTEAGDVGADAALEFFERYGTTPLPPYIQRAPDAQDRERYQSIFARESGAVAAPTASLHFDAGLMDALAAQGVQHAFVTLHVGAGTFQPIRAARLEDHVMHGERVTIDETLCNAVRGAKARGARVIAVGTTVARALEAAAERGLPLAPWRGETRLFIRPGYRFGVIDALVTNFHLPQSTLLMLVCAFAGTTHVLDAYRYAVRERYRFFSYGDAMLATPARAAA